MATLLTTKLKAFGSYYAFQIKLYYTSQSVSNNKTQGVYAEVYLTNTNGSGYISTSASRSYSGSIGGNAVNGSYSLNIAKGTTSVKLFTTASKSFTHDSKGKKTITVALTFAVNATISGSSISTISISFEVDLPDIPRASAISALTSAVTVNGTNKSTLTLIAADSSFTHKVKWSIGDYSYTSSTIAAGTTSAAYAIPASWLNAIPDAASGLATAVLYTYSGNVLIGSASKTFTIKCPTTSEYCPGFTTTLSDAAGIFDLAECYVKGKSKFKVDITGATGVYGADIAKISVAMNGTTYVPAAGETASATSGTLKTAGSNSIVVTVTDSRGLSTSKTLSAEVYTYSSPGFSALTISRCHYDAETDTYIKDDEGRYALVEYVAKISAIGTNAIEGIEISYAGTTDGVTEAVTVTDSSGNVYVQVDTEQVYVFQIAISDKLSKAIYTKPLSTATTIMDILNGGKGLCVGGVATREGFEVLWPVYLPYKMQAGHAAITPVANEVTSMTIEFPTPFKEVPVVVATAVTTVPGTTVIEVGVQNITLTGCDIYLYRTNATETYVSWIAMIAD